jgi:hypothetical protein
MKRTKGHAMTSPIRNHRRQAERASRREFLKVAATAPFALGSLLGASPAVARAQASTPLPLIILFLSGGVSAKESFNPDPAGTPADFKGPLGSIPTRAPGIHFAEGWSELASRSDKFALLRSLDSGSADHTPAMQTAVFSGGQTVSERIGARASSQGVPYVLLNPGSTWSGLHTAFRQTEALVPVWRSQAQWFDAPQMPAVPHCNERRALLEGLDTTPVHSPEADRVQHFRETAFDLLQGGGQFFEALDLPEEDRERYGSSLAGDLVLTAKRFVEQGAGAVTIYHEPEPSTWDMHSEIGPRMRRLAPEMDLAAATLIDEIAEGDLRCVLLMMGEFNRAPRMNTGGGRDHWPHGNCAILAGGAIRGGAVHGRTDRRGAIIDGAMQQRDTLANTVLVACGQELGPNLARVREIVR